MGFGCWRGAWECDKLVTKIVFSGVPVKKEIRVEMAGSGAFVPIF